MFPLVLNKSRGWDRVHHRTVHRDLARTGSGKAVSKEEHLKMHVARNLISTKDFL